jgi:hypothetical protein
MMNQPPNHQRATHAPQPAGGAPWLVLFALDFSLSVVTLVVFGVFGGVFMLLALNGFDGRRGGAILMGYAAVVLAGNAAVACLLNWMILRVRRAVAWRAVFIPALVTTAIMLFVGPPLAFLLIRFGFGR